MDLDMNFDEADPLYKRVLSRKLNRLIDDLDVARFLDSLVTKDIIKFSKIRDIREIANTSDKVREIVKLFRQRSHEDYLIFLICLDDSRQEFLRMELEKEEERLTSEISGMTSERNNTRGSGDGENPSPTVPSSRDQTTAANMTKDTERTHIRHRGTADLQQGLSAPGRQGNNAVQMKESVCIEKQQTPDPGGQKVINETKQGTSSTSTKVTIPTGEAATTAQKQETTSPGRQETMQPGVKVAYVAPMQVDLTEQTKTSKTGTLEMLEFIKKYPTEDIDSLTKRLMAMNITSKIPEKETRKLITSLVSEMTVPTDGATGGMDKMTRLPAVPDEEVIGFDEPNTVPSSSLSSLLPNTDVRKLEDGSLLLTEHYDVGLVYADEDDKMANEVMTSLKKMDLGTEGSDCENCPKVIGFDESPLFIAKQTKLMEIIYKHCTLLFVIISEHKLSSFAEELQDSSFMKSVDERKNKVLPLITQKDHKKHIPHHMSNCRALEYYNQSKFDRQVKSMIQLYQPERLKRLQENLTSPLG